MAKDVVSFLTWAAEPEADERKLVLLLFVLTLTSSVHIISLYGVSCWREFPFLGDLLELLLAFLYV
jgi:hypothetical protein